jgi:hypothetical protein
MILNQNNVNFSQTNTLRHRAHRPSGVGTPNEAEERMKNHTMSQRLSVRGEIAAGNRRSQVGRRLVRAISVAAFVVWTSIPCLAEAQQNNEGLDIVPLNITNNLPNARPLFVYIYGQLAANSISYRAGTAVFVTDLQGNVSITPSIPATEPISLGLNVGIGTSISMMLPKLIGTRIYFSLINGLLVQTNSSQGAIPSAPCGWCGTGNIENATNFNTIFEFAELTWVDKNGGSGHETNLGGNVTEVDLFGEPLHLTFQGNDPANPGIFPVVEDAGFTQSRSTIMTAYANLGSPWTSLLLKNNPGTNLRVVAPYHGIEMGVFPADQLDTYINGVWSSSTLSVGVTAACGQDGGIIHRYVGQNSGGNLVFREGGAPKFQFPKPTTLTVYRNEIAASTLPFGELTACLARAVAAKLGGALVRTVLVANPNLDACMPNQFYLNAPVTKYAQLFHQFGIGNLAYAFGYDDTCDQSSFITVDNPTAVNIAISATQ